MPAPSTFLAQEAHPRIRFVQVPTGERRATLVDGPEVWTIAEAWLAHDQDERSVAVLARTLGLTTEAIATALDYWGDYRDEIDGVLARHRLAQDEALAAWERRRALEGA